MGISKHPIFPWIATIFGTIMFGFGVAYTCFPRDAFSTFGFPSPTTPADLKLMDAVMILYGVKDLYMGISVWATTWLGSRRLAGLLLFAGALCAGEVCGVSGDEYGGVSRVSTLEATMVP